MTGSSFYSFIEEAFAEHCARGLSTQVCKTVDTVLAQRDSHGGGEEGGGGDEEKKEGEQEEKVEEEEERERGV